MLFWCFFLSLILFFLVIIFLLYGNCKTSTFVPLSCFCCTSVVQFFLFIVSFLYFFVSYFFIIEYIQFFTIIALTSVWPLLEKYYFTFNVKYYSSSFSMNSYTQFPSFALKIIQKCNVNTVSYNNCLNSWQLTIRSDSYAFNINSF